MAMTMEKIYKMITMNECVEKVEDITTENDKKNNIVRFKIKCNDKYVADVLTEENSLEKRMNYINDLFAPPWVNFEYEVEVI